MTYSSVDGIDPSPLDIYARKASRSPTSVTRSFQQYSSPEWRNAYENAVPSKFVDYQDPTYLGFYVKFYGLGADGTGERPIGDTGNFVPLDEFPGGLFYHEEHPDSAIRYLKNIGEYTRAQMLREFVMGIKKLSEEMPWYWVKVSGLEAVWQIKKGDSFRGKDLKLSFELLESIDLKITYLLDLYRKATFDSVYMRWMLPSNLRTFEMDLVITEIRTIQRPANVTSNDPRIAMEDSSEGFRNRLQLDTSNLLNQSQVPGLAEKALQTFIADNIPNTQAASFLSNAAATAAYRDYGAYSSYPILMKNFNELATFLVFNFSQCEFMPWEEAPPYLSTVSKIPETMAAGKLTIQTPIVREFNTYGLLGAVLEDTLYNVSRTKDQADKLFPAGIGGNANSATVPNSELGYLEGIKNESFEGSKQNSNQRLLRENNKSLLNAANSFSSNVVAGGIKNLGTVSLGNVLLKTFEPTVAESIANKVVLESPKFIQHLLENVDLVSTNTELEGVPSPSNIELSQAPISKPSSTNVTLVAPVIKNAETAKIELVGPSQNNSVGGPVDLQEPPIGPALSAKVDFGNTGATLLGNTGKTDLVGSGSLEGSTGKVELQSGSTTELVGKTGKSTLEGEGTLQGELNKVEFTAIPVSEGGGSVDLTAPPNNETAITQVNLSGPPIGLASAENVELSSPPVGAATDKRVDLSSPTVTESGPSKVVLQGQGSIEGDSQNVDLEAPPKSANASAIVSLESPQINVKGTGKVDFEETPKSLQNITKTDLEEPPKTNNAISSVDLNAPIKQNTPKGKTDLIQPPTTDVSPGFVEFESASIQMTNPGKEELLSPKKSDTTLNKKVNLQEPKIADAELEKINLQSAPIKNPILGEDILTGNDESLIGSTGKVSLNSPPEKETDIKNVTFETPPGKLDVTDIGNADLQEP